LNFGAKKAHVHVGVGTIEKFTSQPPSPPPQKKHGLATGSLSLGGTEPEKQLGAIYHLNSVGVKLPPIATYISRNTIET